MRYFTILAAAMICILFACSNGIIDPTYLSKIFRGITYTDRGGNILGPIDNSDWNFSTAPLDDQFWPVSKSIKKTVPLPTGFRAIAYPNPVIDSILVEFGLPVDCNWRAVIINENQQVLARFTGYSEAGILNFVWNLNDLYGNPVPQGMYRVIYKFYNIPLYCKLTCSGYGDIWVIDKNTVLPF